MMSTRNRYLGELIKRCFTN